MKKQLPFVLVILAVAGFLTSEDDSAAVEGWQRGSSLLSVLAEKIVLDGRLDERPGRGRQSAFTARRTPTTASRASEKTDVWLAYDDEAIYVAVTHAHSKPAKSSVCWRAAMTSSKPLLSLRRSSL